MLLKCAAIDFAVVHDLYSWVNMMLYMANLDQHYRYFRQYTHDPYVFHSTCNLSPDTHPSSVGCSRAWLL